MLVIGNTYRIEFPVITIPSGDIQIFIKVALNNKNNGVNYNVLADDYGLKLQTIGKRKESWNEKELFIVLGEFNVTILDTKGTVLNPLFSDDLKADDSGVEFWKRSTSGWNKIFSGSLNAKPFSGTAKNEYELSFSPLTQRLATAPTNKENNNKEIVFNDLFGGKYNVYSGNYYPLIEVIHDFFKIINPNINLQVINNWTFYTNVNGTEYSCSFNQLGINFRSIFRREISTQNYIFLDDNYMASLKATLLSMGMFGGALNDSEALILPFFDYLLNEGNRVVVNNSNLIDYKRSVSKTSYKYLELKTNNYIWSAIGNASSIKEFNYSVPIRGGGIFAVKVGSAYYPITAISGMGMEKVNWITYFLHYFANYYLSSNATRLDKLKLSGVDYSLRNTFIIDNNVFVAVNIERNDLTNVTELDLIPIGQNTYSNNTTTPPPSLSKPGVLVGDQIIGEVLEQNGDGLYKTTSIFRARTTVVFRNGGRQILDRDYTEVDTNTIRFIDVEAHPLEEIIIDYYKGSY